MSFFLVDFDSTFGSFSVHLTESLLCLTYPPIPCHNPPLTVSSNTRSRGRINVMGGLRYHDRKSLNFFVDKGNGESFFKSLEKLNNFVCTEWVGQGNKNELYERIGPRILVILDNASYHKRQDIIDEIEQALPNIQLCFLPAYSPDLNLIELVWHSCKARWGEYPPSRLYVKSLLPIGYLKELTSFK